MYYNGQLQTTLSTHGPPHFRLRTGLSEPRPSVYAVTKKSRVFTHRVPTVLNYQFCLLSIGSFLSSRNPTSFADQSLEDYRHSTPISREATMYPVEESKVDLREQQYQDNHESWVPILERFETSLYDVCSEGAEASLARHQERGQLLRAFSASHQHPNTILCSMLIVRLTARDRIALLLDQDSPFLELCPFAGFGNSNSTPCGNLISGIGVVRYEGRSSPSMTNN